IFQISIFKVFILKPNFVGRLTISRTNSRKEITKIKPPILMKLFILFLGMGKIPFIQYKNKV
ncbi:TPA: hypothetical protein ACIOSD_001967, partial [Streptococcus agalactiae]